MWQAMEYETFELLVGPKGADGYPVTVIQSPAGEASALCVLDPLADDVQAALRRIEADDTDARLLAALGCRLFDALFPDPIALLFRASLGLTRGQGKGLRVRLRLEPPELAALPWEYMCDGRADCFLSISPEMPLVRYVPMARPSRPIAARPPLRVLAVLCSPSDAPPLNVEREKGIIEQALARWVDQGMVQLHVLERGTVAEIGEAMRCFRPHVFHFVGHGQYDGDQAYVVLEDEEGHARLVGERAFREFFLGVAEARLAVLNACQTARTSSARPLTGIAPRLLQRNLSAVVAMQYPIADDTAAVFTREFYRSLAQGYPVDGAIAEARKGIFMEVGGDLRDWGIPVLFLRAQDGRLFEWAEEEEVQPAVPPPPEPAPPPLARGFVGRQAELAYFADELAARHLAVITGMPGVGKTALASVLAGLAGEPGKIFWHTFHEGEGIEEVVWELAGFLYWHGRKDLWQMLQGARQSGGQPPPPAVLFDYLFQMLRGQGFTLCLDDLDYVDNDPHMDQFLERLRPALQEGDVSLIVAAQRVPSFVQADEFEALGGLSLEDTVQLLAERGLAVKDTAKEEGEVHPSQILVNLWDVLSADMVVNLHARTEGNASLLTLSVDALKRAPSPGRFLLEMFKDEDVERFLIEDIDGSLAEQERAVMGAVAVLLGYPGTREAVEAALGGENARRPLRDLRQRHLLNVREGERGREYSVNAVVRYFYYDALSRHERQEMHRRAGAHYETEEPDALKAARHYEQAKDARRAAGLITDDVWAIINQGQARLLCQVLARFAPQQVDPGQWVRVKLALGQVQAFLGEGEAAQASYHEALSSLDARPGAPEARNLRANVCRWLAELHYQRGEYASALEWVQEGLSALEGDDRLAAGIGTRTAMPAFRDGAGRTPVETAEAAELALIAAHVHMRQGDYTSALAHGQDGLHLGQRLGQVTVMARACNVLGRIANHHGENDTAVTYFEQSLSLYQQLGDQIGQAKSHNLIGSTHFEMGRWAEAERHFRRAYEIFERLGDAYWSMGMSNNLGYIALNQGRLDEALSCYQSGLELLEKRGGSLYLKGLLHMNLGATLIQRNELDQARHHLRTSLAYSEQTQTRDYLPDLYRYQAEVALLAGALDEAEARGQASLALTRELGMRREEGRALHVLGEVAMARGRGDRAGSYLGESLSIFEQVGDEYEGARSQLFLACLAALGGKGEDGLVALDRCTPIFERLGTKGCAAAAGALREEMARGSANLFAWIFGTGGVKREA